MLLKKTISRAPRVLRRWRTALLGSNVELIYHPAYRLPDNSIVDARRGERILRYLLHAGGARKADLHRPPAANMEQLRLVHTAQYLESLDHDGVVETALGTDPGSVDPAQIVAQQRAMVGGTVGVARRR